MNRLIFFDVDTQYDFLMPHGALYVPGGESIIPALAQLTLFARHHGIRILGDVDWHLPANPEISANPDYQITFPPHCIQGTPGARKIAETEPENPLWIDSERYLWKELERKVKAHSGEIFFRKNQLDVFSNPNIDYVLDMLKPDGVVVYGVVTEFCVACAVEGFLKRGDLEVMLLEDAVKEVSKEKATQKNDQWRIRGVQVMKTEELLRKGALVG